MLKSAIFAACFLSVALALESSRVIPLGERTAFAFREAAANFDNLDERGRVDTINEISDMIMTEVRLLMGDLGLDPLELPEVHKNFSIKPIIITYHGELDLTRGWAQDVSEVYRNGDVKVDYTGRKATVEVPIIFYQFLFDYEYNIKLMGLGPSGGVEGKIVDIKIFFSLSLDFEKLEMTLNKFDITHIGKITVKFTGNGLIDWLVNFLTGFVTGIFKGLVTFIAEIIVRNTLVNIIELVNDLLANLQPSPSEEILTLGHGVIPVDPVQMILFGRQNL